MTRSIKAVKFRGRFTEDETGRKVPESFHTGIPAQDLDEDAINALGDEEYAVLKADLEREDGLYVRDQEAEKRAVEKKKEEAEKREAAEKAEAEKAAAAKKEEESRTAEKGQESERGSAEKAQKPAQ